MSASGKDCPVCECVSPFRTTRQVAIYECPSCGLVFSEAKGIIDCCEPFWGGCAATIERQENVAREMALARLSFYAAQIGRPVRSIIEVGCGLAPWARAFSEHGVHYVGVEVVEDVAAAARRRTGADIRAGDFTTMRHWGRADVVFCSQVLEHVASPRPFLERAREIAELLHLDVPNHASVMSGVRRVFGRQSYGMLQPPHHLRAYSPRTLTRALELAGFAVTHVAAERNDHPVLGQTGRQSALHHRVGYRIADAVGRGSLLVATARAAV